MALGDPARTANHGQYRFPAGISAAGNTECGAIIALSGRKFGLRKVRALMRVCTSNSGFALGDCAGIWGPESSTCAPAFSEFLLRAASGNREAEFALHTHAQSTRKTTTPEFEVKPLLPTRFRAHGSRASESGIRKLAGRLRSRACPGAGASDQRRADAVAADQPRETSCRWLASPAVIAIASDGDRRVSHGPRLRCGEDINSPNECVGFGLDQVKFQIPDSGMPTHVHWFRVGPTT